MTDSTVITTVIVCQHSKMVSKSSQLCQSPHEICRHGKTNTKYAWQVSTRSIHQNLSLFKSCNCNSWTWVIPSVGSDLHRLVYKGCWSQRGWVEHSCHLPFVCSDAWDRKGCQEHATRGLQKWTCLKQKVASDGPFSPTKGFIFSYTKKVMGNMASGYIV